MIGTDAFVLPVLVWIAFALQHGQWLPELLPELGWLMVLATLAGIVCFAVLGLYHAVVRYLGPQAVVAVVQAATLSTLAFAALATVFHPYGPVPPTVYVLYWMLVVLAVGGTRFCARAVFRRLQRGGSAERVAVYGAGAAGIQLVQALNAGHEYRPVLFVDDNPMTHGTVINGLKVHAPDALGALVGAYRLETVLLAMPSVPRSRRREIVDRLASLGLQVKTLPAMVDLLSGRSRIDDMREVGVDDLLGRDPVAPVPHLLDRCIRGKHVLVTGAGGSIGGELCRQIVQRSPATLLLLEHSEYALYRIERELRSLLAALPCKPLLVPLLGSVLDERRVRRVMRTFGIQTVYHSAAYKHVPLVEANVLEGVRNNVFGTMCAARAALAADVERFVLVSTDKAVRPTNVMGATKRFAELSLQALVHAGQGRTCFSMVRFGNVLGSSGSVVPLFRRQIARGGPVTVTHPDISRYFMTIPEAATLVIQAGGMATGGDVFVLDMGRPVRIVDLARRMIQLSGLSVRDADNPQGDIAVELVGMRPGEKLFEELLLGENVSRTLHPMILRAEEEFLTLDEVNSRLERLEEACRRFEPEVARELLSEVVDGYAVNGATHDLLWNGMRRPAGASPGLLPAAGEQGAEPAIAREIRTTSS